ncbi:MAG: hypothetical protein ACI3W8_06230 [Oscillospiraceae bacterium]
MMQKLFGETEEDQIRYLKPRLLAILAAIICCVIGAILQAAGLDIASVFLGLGEVILVITLWVFGWAILRGLFGIASIGVLFSNNVVLGVIIFLIYLLVGYIGGAIVAVIGLCRFMVLKKKKG